LAVKQRAAVVRDDCVGGFGFLAAALFEHFILQPARQRFPAFLLFVFGQKRIAFGFVFLAELFVVGLELLALFFHLAAHFLRKRLHGFLHFILAELWLRAGHSVLDAGGEHVGVYV